MEFIIRSFIFVALVWMTNNVHSMEIDRICPRMLHKVFNGYAPIGKLLKIDILITNSNKTFTILIFYLICR